MSRWKKLLRAFSIQRTPSATRKAADLSAADRACAQVSTVPLSATPSTAIWTAKTAADEHGGDAAHDGHRSGRARLVGQRPGDRHEREHDEQGPGELADVDVRPGLRVGVLLESGGRVVRLGVGRVQERHGDLDEKPEDRGGHGEGEQRAVRRPSTVAALARGRPCSRRAGRKAGGAAERCSWELLGRGVRPVEGERPAESATLAGGAFASLSIPCRALAALRGSAHASGGRAMSQVEVRLLGPFELATAEGPQHLPGHGERALLAVLALSAGRAVALPTLVEALWDPDHQPEDPVNALQVRVSKLRRALAAIGAGDVVERQGFRLPAA